MATRKAKIEVKTANIDFSNSIEKIKETAKTVNNEVINTAFEVITDLRNNGRQLTEVTVETVTDVIENATIDNGVKLAKKTAKNINEYGIETAEELLEGVVKGGQEWQKLLTKTLKGGVSLYGQQQDMVLTALESLKGQYDNGTFRLKNLFQFNFDFGKAATKTAKKGTKKAVTTVKAKAATAKKTVAKAKTATRKVAAKATKSATKKVTAKVTKPATKKGAVQKVTAKVVKPTVKKVAAKVIKPATKKVTAKKVATPTKVTASAKNNLRLIEGVGPKIEELLNKGGIYTFQQLADAKQGSLKGILAAGGSRYKMHNPTTWSKQAALAAAGKREELKKWQAELKGGKAVK